MSLCAVIICSCLINQGGLNKFNGQHALRERARKLDQGILIIRFGSFEMFPVSIYDLTPSMFGTYLIAVSA